MRVASIHVSWKDLESALEEQGAKVCIKTLQKQLKGKELKRFFTLMSAKEVSKVSLKQEDAFVSKIISICTAVRRDSGHKGLVLPSKGSTAFDQYRVVAARIKSLADDYEEEPEVIADLYFKRALALLGKKYNLSRLMSETTHDNVVSDIEKSVSIVADPNRDYTAELFNYYCSKAAASKDKLLKSTAYSFFVDAASMAIAVGASAKDWVDAQFDGLSFTGSNPRPEQLCTPSAEDRFLNYRANGRESKKEPQTKDAYQLMLEKRIKERSKK